MKVTVDEHALNAAREKFNRAVAMKISVTGLAVKDCVIVESGRLCELLIKRTPPQDAGRANALRERIEKKVTKRFERLTSKIDTKQYQSGGKFGRGEVCWIKSAPTFLYGERRDAFLVKDLDMLWGIFLRTARLRSEAVQQPQPRGSQKVYIRTGASVSRADVARLVKRLQRHVGRLKAGWLTAYRAVQRLGFRGAWQPNKFVLNNETGNRGDFNNGLQQDPTKPFIDVINRARDVNKNYMRTIAHHALESRVKYVVKRLQVLVKHPELIGQEMAGEESP